MTQLAIATELHEQAIADFRVSERFAYAFIMKVKQIRNERLYKELGFTSFEDYCESAWNTVRRSMDERIQIAESFGQPDFESTYSHLGHSKSLLLARMEPEIRQQIESSTDVNEATVKQLKEAEQRVKKAESESQHWQAIAKTAQSQPPRVITQTIEIVSASVKKKVEDLEFDNTNLKHGYREAKEKLQKYELHNTIDFDAEQAKKQREKMQHEADYNALEVRVHINQFLEKVAITSYVQGAITAADPITKRKLLESVAMLESFTTQIKAALNGRILGGIVNE